MSLYISQNFKLGYKDRVTGSGLLETNTDGSVLTVTAPDGAGQSAFKDWYFLVSPGDEIDFSVWAKKISGTGIPRISVDLNANNGGVLSNIFYENVESLEWRLYKAKFTVPYTVANFTDAKISFGKWGSLVGDCQGQFMLPKLNVKSPFAAPQVYAMGMVRIIDGVVDIHPQFRSYGILSGSYDDTSKAVTLVLSKRVNQDSKPVMTATGTYERNEIPTLGQYQDATNPTVKLAFSNGSSKVSLATGSFYAYVQFMI